MVIARAEGSGRGWEKGRRGRRGWWLGGGVTYFLEVTMELIIKEITGNGDQVNITFAYILNDITHDEAVMHPRLYIIKTVSINLDGYPTC